MKRLAHHEGRHWNDPFWQTIRMFVDILNSTGSTKPRSTDDDIGEPLTEDQLLDALTRKDTTTSKSFIRHLEVHLTLTSEVGQYLFERASAIQHMLKHLRSEEDAVQQLVDRAGNIEITEYGTQSADHHQSKKIMVATIDWLTQQTLSRTGVGYELNPQSRAAIFEPDRMHVSPRRLDGAIPSLLNPVALWEIKEYWGGSSAQSGGSKMSDAIYECQLVGTELRMYEDNGGQPVKHYLVFDGLRQWKGRKSDLGRAYDLLSSGLLDELIVGDEVFSDWPRIAEEAAALAKKPRPTIPSPGALDP